MHSHTEQEWQFAAGELDAARKWLAAQPHAGSERRFASQPTVELSDTYYDSPDWMIYRAGFALRLRRSRNEAANDEHTEITLKSLELPRGALARRREYTEQIDGGDLSAVLARQDGIAERIRELVGTRALAPLFHARTRRERQHLLEADTELPLAEFDLDDTSIETPAGAAQQLRRVEVECLNAEPAALEPWVASLCAAAGLQSVAQSKFRAGVAAAGLDPAAPPALGSTEIRAAAPAHEALLAALRRYFAQVLEQEPQVRMGSVTAVHAMRVAARHLDVFLKFSRRDAPAFAYEARAVVRDLVKALGAVRDCDVQLAHLGSVAATLAAVERAAMQPLRERLEGERTKARAGLLRLLDASTVRNWFGAWREQLPAGATAESTGTPVSSAQFARTLIRAQARKLRKRAQRIDRKSGVADFHDVRIRAKRLRYTLDAFAALYGDAAREFTRALAKLQDVLGAYHDATMREQRFAALVAEAGLPAASAFTIGRLVERDALELERCQEKFPKAYRRARRRRWRALLAVMDEVAAAPPAASATS